MKNLLLLGVSLFIFSANATSFSIKDHRRITEQAIAELNQCLPDSVSEYNRHEMVVNNILEDLSPLKWIYSHYYHPEKPIHDLYRLTAAARIQSIENIIRNSHAYPGFQGLYNPSIQLGHAVHLIQDMAVPLHVIPIRHGLDDQFEKHIKALTDDQFRDLIGTEWDCAPHSFPMIENTLFDIFQATATITLSTIRSEIRFVKNNKTVITGTWQYFWEESDTTVFGNYGIFGNQFGKSSLSVDSDSYTVPPKLYKELEQSQLRLAIDATKQAIAWSQIFSSPQQRTLRN